MTATPRCADTVGPVPKLDNATLVCDKPAGHDMPHYDESEHAWWEPSS